MRDIDAAFVEHCIASGMSSGEGLIAEVADASENQLPVGEKRRLVVESEFAQVMKVLAREGNTLSPVIRNAWDGKTLQTMAKNSPLRATGAHIGIVGHITKQELLRHITATELANGFFNRFMVLAVQRSKTLPFGGRLDGDDLARVREQVRLAARFAAVEQHISFDPAARECWIAAYDELSRGEAGLAGAATARAEAHTVRVALLYALLDCSAVIQLEHLEAALAFWAYSAASARWVFGDSIGDPTADESGRSPATATTASPAPRSPTCSHATRKPAKSTARSKPSSMPADWNARPSATHATTAPSPSGAQRAS